MSPRGRYTSKAENSDVRLNISRTTVIAVAVSEYIYLPKLPGTRHDIEMIGEIFQGNQIISLYPIKYTHLSNPTANQFRKSITEYSLSRSAKGDILILYFSGHGAVLGANDFAFCLKDTATGIDESKILSVSTVSFRDVVQTLSSVDVYPVFIIDACFSGLTAPQGTISVTAGMQDFLHTYFAGSYALLTSSSIEAQAFETAFGGFFTRTFHSVVINGLEDSVGRHMPFLTLNNLSATVQDRLSKEGHPLSRCYIAPDMIQIPIAKNIKFRPDTEKFGPYMKKIIEYAWNNGSPRLLSIDELLINVGKGAYANHSKLSLSPWNILEDGADNSTRRLTKNGELFASGQLEIPQYIIRDSITWDWIPMPGTKMIKFQDIKYRKNKQGTA